MEFNYETRPDVWTSYRLGAPVTITQRLSYIDVKMNGAMVRRYQLTYTDSVNSKNSLLTQVQEFGSDATTLGTGTPLPPTIFQYSASSNDLQGTGGGNWTHLISSASPVAAEFTGDGRADIVYCANGQWTVAYSTSAGISPPNGGGSGPACSNPIISYGDFTGDGAADLAVQTSAGISVYSYSPYSFSLKFNWAPPASTNPNGTIQLFFGDYNGDGKTDIGYTIQYAAGASQCTNMGITGSPCTGFWVQLSSGTTFGTAAEWTAYAATPVWTKFLDLNGDGKADMIQDLGSGGLHVMLSTGSGLTDAGAWLTPAPSADVSLWRFGDFNGDGLQDFALLDATLRKVTVYLNDGKEFIQAPTPWLNLTDHWADVNRIFTGDFNGDGKTDLIDYQSTPTSSWDVRLSSGAGFDAPGSGNWAPAATGTYADLFADFDGDGKTDHAEHFYNGDGLLNVQLSSGPAINLATTIKNSLGGSVLISYQPFSIYYQRSSCVSLTSLSYYLPFVMQTVNAITTDDGMGHQNKISYYYGGALYDPVSREFRGFSQVTESNATGECVRTIFDQTDQLKGKPKSIETYNWGPLLAKTVNTWSYTTPYTGVTFPFLQQEDVYSYDGTYTATFNQAETAYQYDSYGNVKRVDHLGDVNITTDNRYDYMEYAYNTTDWIVSLPVHVYTNKSDNATKISETFNYYDGAAINTTSPTKGDLTQVCRWLSSANAAVCSTSGYDLLGNRVSFTDANGNRSTVVYDATYQTYPSIETNALNQSVTKAYDGLGRLTSTTDPNNITSSYQYDPLHRLTAEIIPPDTAAAPTTVRTYYNFAAGQGGTIIPGGTLVQKRQAVGGGTLDTYTFVDGLGRTIQAKTPSSDGANQNVVDTVYTTYTRQSLVDTISIPYLSPTTASYTTPITTVKNTKMGYYDGLRRITQITNTDGTYSSRAYNKWATTLIDPNGHEKVETRDAFGRLVRVDEYTGADGRAPGYTASAYALYATTTYGYDTFDAAGNNIRTIVDALGNKTTTTYDSLGRKVGMHDPDMGDWSYQYDPVGNLILQTDAKGQMIGFAYDPINRIKIKGLGPFPDLVPTALTVSTSGISLVLNDALKNQSTTVDAGPFSVAFYLSESASYQPATALFLCDRSVSALPAGASNPATGTVQTTCSIPQNAAAGSYYVVVVEDSRNDLMESNENNNTQVTTTAVTVGPELVVAQIVPNASSVNTGANLSVSDTIQNLANIPAGAFTVDYRLSTDPVYGDADDILLGATRSIASLPALASNAATTSLAIPSTIPAGLYYICAKADSANAITETDETNNTLCSASRVTVVDATSPTVGNLVATALSATQVNLTWTGSDNTGIDHYEVERSPNNVTYTLLSKPTAAAFTDTTVTGGATYFYRVRAYDLAGNAATSNIDLATTVIFTDDPIVSGSTMIKATHIMELRQAVNAVRASAGLAAVTNWTDPSLAAGMVIKAAHIQELRNNLNPALTSLGLTPPAYTDPTITPGVTQIKKAHVDEIRNAVK